jgi:hypothetical protein
MVKLYSFLLLFVTTNIINAQITLTSATNTPVIGDSYTYVYIPDYAFDVSQSGANKTWDFSSATGTEDSYSCISLSSSSKPSNFPSANLVLVSATYNTESYLSTSSSEISIEGAYIAGTGMAIYSDKQEYLKFPMTYNDVFNETFSGTVENISAGQTFDRVGTIEITADGYGNLILPYTTISNVLRIKVVNISSDTYMGFPLPETTTISYFWFDTLNKNYLANTSEVYNLGSLISSYAYYLSETDLVLDANKSNYTDNQLSFFPNPVNDYAIIKNNSFYKIPISIYDTKSSLIKTLDIKNGENRIDTSDLLSGIYIIKYQQDSKLYVSKLVVK